MRCFLLLSFAGLFTALFSATPLFAQPQIQQIQHIFVDHPYFDHTVRTAVSGDRVLPFSTLAVNFDRILTESEQERFEKEFFLRDEGTGRAVAHLHQVVEGLSVRGPHASFQWLVENDRSVLWYRPFLLQPGKRFEIVVPPDWPVRDEANLFFSTLALTGNDLRIYAIVFPDLEEWKSLTVLGAADPVTDFVEAYFFDVSLAEMYPVQIRLRGGISRLLFKKKSYTIKFPSDGENQFRGFKYSSGNFQGRNRRIVLSGGDDFGFLLRNRVSYDTVHPVHERIFGASLAPDSYFAVITVNGQLLGVDEVIEHLSTGPEGFTTTKDRRERLGLKEKALLHEFNGLYGERIEGFLPWMGFIPQTNSEFLVGRGDGSRVSWSNTDFPFPIFVPPLSGNSPFEVDVKVESTTAAGKVALIPDPTTFEYRQNANGDLLLHQFNLMNEKGRSAAGKVQNLDTESAAFEFTLPQPALPDKRVQFEFRSTYDLRRFGSALKRDERKVFSWVDRNSALAYTFFVRLFAATENMSSQNRFFLLNYDDLSTLYAPDGAPKERYHLLLWDCDLSFHSSDPEPRVGLTSAEPWFRVARESPAARQDYVNLFAPEREHGVLRLQFYEELLQRYRRELGNSLVLEDARWNPDPPSERQFDILLDYLRPKLANESYVQNVLLSLSPDQWLPPKKFIRGDIDENQVLQITDAVTLLQGLFLGDTGHGDIVVDRSDVDDDGEVNISDAVAILSYLFLASGKPPAPPFPLAGVDPTADDLPS